MIQNYFIKSIFISLPNIDKLLNDRIRVEFTIKNKKHFKLI